VPVADHHLRVGCAAPTAPPALRRRLFGLWVGERTSVLAVPVKKMTVWPETGPPACWSQPEPRAGNGPPPGGPRFAHPLRFLRGSLRVGSTQHPRDATRERCADDGSPSGDRESAASGPSIMYAGDRGRTEGSELEPPAPALRSARWVATASLRGDDATRRTERLRVRGTTRWIFPSG